MSSEENAENSFYDPPYTKALKKESKQLAKDAKEADKYWSKKAKQRNTRKQAGKDVEAIGSIIESTKDPQKRTDAVKQYFKENKINASERTVRKTIEALAPSDSSAPKKTKAQRLISYISAQTDDLLSNSKTKALKAAINAESGKEAFKSKGTWVSRMLDRKDAKQKDASITTQV